MNNTISFSNPGNVKASPKDFPPDCCFGADTTQASGDFPPDCCFGADTVQASQDFPCNGADTAKAGNPDSYGGCAGVVMAVCSGADTTSANYGGFLLSNPGI